MRVWATIALLVFFSGCGSRTVPASSSLRIVQTQTFNSLNPIYVSGVGGQELAALLFSYLVKFDDHGRLVPDVALAVPSRENGGISADGKTITYRLRPGVRFSDGSALTSHDVAYTIGWIADRRSDAPSRLGYDHVASVDTPDELTVRVHLRRPYAPALIYLCAPGNAVPILPAARIRDATQLAKSPFSSAPVGSGPYLVSRWDRGDRLELHANPLYWGGRPAIETIVIRFVPTSTTAADSVRSGEADAYVNADATQYEELTRIPKVRVTRVPIGGTGALFFNMSDPIARERAVRFAFAEAIDAPHLIAKSELGATRAAEPGRGLMLWAYDAKAFSMPRYDPHNAARLLDAAGWRMGPDGLRHRGGVTLSLSMILRGDKPSSTVLATAIQAAERAVGIDVTLRRYPVVTLVAPAAQGGPLYGGHFSVALFPFLAGFDPDMTDQFACDRIPPRGFNKPRYCNPKLDTLMARAAETYSTEERVRYYHDVQQILANDLPIVTLYQAVSIDVFPARLTGQTSAIHTPFWNVGAWRL
jgi:peptide/nickel transport system substrate-binding protein